LPQQHIVTVSCLADATREVARSKRCHIWAGIASSTDDEELGWQDLLHEELN
jgi:hypothetical protein